jgi:hypothetical protein
LSYTTYIDVIHGLWRGTTEITGSHDGVDRSAMSPCQGITVDEPVLETTFTTLPRSFHPNVYPCQAHRDLFPVVANRCVGSSVKCSSPLIFLSHCTITIFIKCPDRATRGPFFFDFHSASHQVDYTKVVPLYTSFDFVTEILVIYSLDQAQIDSKVD